MERSRSSLIWKRSISGEKYQPIFWSVHFDQQRYNNSRDDFIKNEKVKPYGRLLQMNIISSVVSSYFISSSSNLLRRR